MGEQRKDAGKRECLKGEEVREERLAYRWKREKWEWKEGGV